MSLVKESNIEVLIEEIQQRPAIYDYSLKDYSNTCLKKQLWEEICAIVIKNWNDFSADKKNKALFEVQKKWQGLRSCFTRELRNQRKFARLGQSFKKRRKYLYFEKLSFLPCKRPSSFLDGEHADDDTTDSDNGEDSKGSTRISPTSFFVDANVDDAAEDSGRHKKESAEKREKEDYSSFEHYFANSDEEQVNENPSFNEIEVKTENLSPEHGVMFDVLKSSKQFKEDDNGDVLFALSLVPMISSLDECQKVEAKIQILSVLKSIKFSQAGL